MDGSRRRWSMIVNDCVQKEDELNLTSKTAKNVLPMCAVTCWKSTISGIRCYLL